MGVHFFLIDPDLYYSYIDSFERLGDNGWYTIYQLLLQMVMDYPEMQSVLKDIHCRQGVGIHFKYNPKM